MIVEAENRPEALEMLGAQRELYRRAKSWQLAYLTCGIGLPLVVTLIQMFTSLEMPSLVNIVGEMALFLFTLFSRHEVESLVEDAAAVQQRFDAVAYGIGFDHIYTDDAVIAELSEADASRGYTNRPLTNWYDKEIIGLPAPEAVAKCQMINAAYSEDLAALCSRAVLLLATGVITLIAYVALETGSDITTLCFGFTVIESVVELWLSDKDNRQAKHDVREACQKYDLSTEENIRRVQDRILEYRRTPSILVPDALYTLRREWNEKKARRIAASRSHGGNRS